MADSYSSDRNARAWEMLADILDRFLSTWEQHPAPPAIAEFLPAEPEDFRQQTLMELIKVDLEMRWSRKQAPRNLEVYLNDFPAWQPTPSQLTELLYEEHQIRKQAGDPAADDCFQRFPALAAALRQWIGQEVDLPSTTPLPKETHRFEAGTTLDDFDLLLPVGEGAFGTVFLARQRSMQRLVALKIGVNRTDDEPRTLAQLDHENIVRVYDQREIPAQKLRLLYMEFVAGGTLQEVIREVRALPLPERHGKQLLSILDAHLVRAGQLNPGESFLRQELQDADWLKTVALLGIRCAAGLQHAHQRGVLHRDLKPANILLTSSGSPKIADFNISFARDVEGAMPEDSFGGSLLYMSPEQLAAYGGRGPLRPADIDRRSDLYSLALVLWELYTGAHPFGREMVVHDSRDACEQLQKQRAKVPAIPAEYAANDPLLRILQRCLEADRLRRTSSAAELQEELQLVLDPALAALVEPPRQGWRKWVNGWPFLAVSLAAVLPNACAAVFNFTYNRQEIIEQLPSGEWLGKFMLVQSVINAIAFPVGLGLGLRFFAPVARQMKEPQRQAAHAALIRLAQVGTAISAMSLTAWLLAGLAYPISMRMLAGQFPLSAGLHFFASLAICGLIAASYPFLILTFLGLRAFQPHLCAGRIAPLSSVDFPRLAARANWHLLLAAIVPLASIGLLTILNTSSRFALGWLSAGGTCGFILAFGLHQAIQHDAGILQRAK